MLHRFHNRFSQSRRRPLLGPSPWLGRAAIRHYANQPARPIWVLRQRPNFTLVRRFQPGEGPSRGLLCDCENRLWNRWSTAQHYSCSILARPLNLCVKLCSSAPGSRPWNINVFQLWTDAENIFTENKLKTIRIRNPKMESCSYWNQNNCFTS